MILHVSNGHSATGLIERSGLPGRTMVWCDPLHEGPVPGGITDAELLRIRARFLAASEDAADTVASDLARWRASIDDTDAYDELVLWFEHDLFDQLNLIQLLAHLGQRESWPKPVTMICIDRHPGHQDFKGLGELSPSEIAALFPSRLPVTAAQIGVAQRAWLAFRAPEPSAVEAVLHTDTTALPFLADALRRHLEEFPSQRDGLSLSERRLMEQAADGPAPLGEMLPRMHDGERWLYVTDTMLMDRVRALTDASPALLAVAGAFDRQRPSGTIELTAAGRDVLAGRQDRVRLCGLDRWLGGVHLTGRGRDWRSTATGVRLQQ
ncbi:MAG: hypothetical protein ACKOEC_16555 [Acidimicrobiia bacterium]